MRMHHMCPSQTSYALHLLQLRVQSPGLIYKVLNGLNLPTSEVTLASMILPPILHRSGVQWGMSWSLLTSTGNKIFSISEEFWLCQKRLNWVWMWLCSGQCAEQNLSIKTFFQNYNLEKENNNNTSQENMFLSLRYEDREVNIFVSFLVAFRCYSDGSLIKCQNGLMLFINLRVKSFTEPEEMTNFPERRWLSKCKGTCKTVYDTLPKFCSLIWALLKIWYLGWLYYWNAHNVSLGINLNLSQVMWYNPI